MGSIDAPNGLVLLTNQYEPASQTLPGDILINGTGIFGDGIDVRNFTGAGGAVYLDARNNIDVLNSFISTAAAIDVQDIVLVADGVVTFDGIDGTRETGIFNSLALGGTGSSGNVRITATALNVLNGAQLNSLVFGNGQGGDVILNILETVRFEGINLRNSFPSGAFSSISVNSQGTGGNVRIQARNIEVLNGAELSASTFGTGNAGNVIILIDETARFKGTDSRDGSASGAFSRIASSAEGRGGDVRIQARNIEVLNGAELSASTFGTGDAGNVILLIDETARFQGIDSRDGSSASGAFSSIEPNAKGTGGDVRIQARNLEVLDGAQLSTGIFGAGIAGSVILLIDETAQFEGVNSRSGSPSGTFSNIGINGEGIGGDVRIQARNLEVLDGAQLVASTFGIGDAGSVILLIDETAQFEGVNPIDTSISGAFTSIEPNGKGAGGGVRIRSQNLEVLNGAQLSAGTSGIGNAGNVVLLIDETARFKGIDSEDSSASGASSNIDPNGNGTAGDVRIQARNLEVLDGAQLSAGVFGAGDAGNVILLIDETARFEGINPINNSSPSGTFSNIEPNGEGTGGDVRIRARNLEVVNGAQLGASVFGTGNAGSILLLIDEIARFEGSSPVDTIVSGAFTSIEANGNGKGGNVQLEAAQLELNDGAVLSSGSLGEGASGNILLTIRNRLTAKNGTIATNAEQNAGGQIQINAGSILLFGDSDIQTFVDSGENNGGNITIRANALVALDDSDILAFAADGRGGDVDLSETAFFGQNFQFAPPGTDPRTLDNNDRVDINATGGIASGTISLADVSFIEDSLNELPDNLVNPETLVSNSCVVRTNDTDSSFTVTGSDSLEEQPGNSPSTYSLETVQPIPATPETAVAEPQGTYRLADGRLVIGRQCDIDQ
ncbi:beta strand repeat-containing protein [Adonisia turfae]|uniref:S-layer family protein n=1 Tax=Adonisia turfae CCMR0081 TaxID=2292702 RepID=A0A6M0RGN9_9CYAN|nr:S-layer family protein [Adonisia turfae]NEZ55070.1 S-layer family protein [Adonisia turfae CCMR0081]